MDEGRKFDSDKRPWHLLPMKPIEQIVDVLAYGAKKYAANNWQKLADPEDRYYAACLRHLTAWRMGENTDQESGIHHLAHAACNLVFLMWFAEPPRICNHNFIPLNLDPGCTSELFCTLCGVTEIR